MTQNTHTSSSQEDPGSISQLQNNVRQAERRFQGVFDQAAVGMALVSLDGQWLQVNQKLCDILGYTRLELRRMTFQDITHPDDLDADLAYVQQLLAGKIETYAMDKRYFRKDGSLVWAHLTVSLARDKTEAAQYFISVVEDITERKRLEEALYEQQEATRQMAANAEAERQRFYDLFTQAPAFICLLQGPQHVFEFANDHYRRLVGNRGLWQKPAREALSDYDPHFFELLDTVYTTGKPYIGKEVLVYNGGQESYFDFVYQPTRDALGKVDGILVHAVEVTEKVRARENIKKNERRLQLAQRVGRIGTFEWNIPSNKIIWTPELEALYGLPAGGFEGRYENWAQRVHPDDIAEAEENLQRAVAGGPPYNVEFRVIWPDGTTHWLRGMGEIISYDGQGRPQDMVGINIDITGRKETEQQLVRVTQELQDFASMLEDRVNQRTEALNQTNKELQRSNQELQEFAYVASHDLQEPLRKIQSFGNLLEEDHGKELGSGKMYLDRMRQAAARMQVLINDLLTFSRVTTKALPFSTIDLNQIAQEVVDDLEVQIQTTQGTVEIGQLPTIQADPVQMRQMLQNLIGNGLKFHQRDVPPVITVSAELLPATEEEGQAENPAPAYCQLTIKDNGIGFDEKYLDRIFIVFQRLHGKGQYEGTGIGLAVVRKIVERHEGTINATSTLGEGSTFVVTLPISHAAQQEYTYDE
ncbi:PAS domain-containing sensor histidine kinase [Ktedonobacter robiniae]|uniref:histidine kinase n=1 Tax=Ktedonobacter robiniae TaxID=2778365 RepID=A0ABQ3V2Y6_9CHLR|nr:PAS domain-containing sensor histidine kinase [Ktedonobacter robiniae]GHO59323.1 hypothetical protein KSB_77980 [Ktedonobacter robiniae]